MTADVWNVEYAVPVRHKRRWLRWPVWLAVVFGVGLFFTILVPTMCESRPAANRIKSASNLRQIGIGLTAYARGHGGVLPGDFAQLVQDQDLTSDVFLSPSGDLTDRATGATPAEWGRKIVDEPAKYCSYRYVAAGRRPADLRPDAVLAYEPVQNADKDGIHLLYADGHVDWVQANAGTAARRKVDRLVADDQAGVRPLTWAE